MKLNREFYVGGRNAVYTREERGLMLEALKYFALMKDGVGTEYVAGEDRAGDARGPVVVKRRDGMGLNAAEKAALFWFFVGFLDGAKVAPSADESEAGRMVRAARPVD